MINKFEKFEQVNENSGEDKIYYFHKTTYDTYAIRAKDERDATIAMGRVMQDKAMNDASVSCVDGGGSSLNGPELAKDTDELENWEIIDANDYINNWDDENSKIRK